MKKLKLFLFPVLAPLFLLGWIMSVVGDREEEASE